MLGMDGQSLIVYHYISMLCIVVEKYFGIIKENSLIINLSNFLHRKVENKSPTKSVNTKRSARCKLAYIRAGLFGLIGRVAT